MLPKVYDETSKQLRSICVARVDASIEMVHAKIDLKEQQLIRQFDEKAWLLVSEEFGKAFDSKYLAVVNPRIQAHRRSLATLSRRMREFPNDASVRTSFYEKQSQVNSIVRIPLKDERELRFALMEKLEESRSQILGSITAKLAPIRKKLDQKRVDACGEKRQVPRSLVILESNIEQYGAELIMLQSIQISSLNNLDDFINKKSAINLAFRGVRDEVRDRLGVINGYVETGLNEAKNFYSKIGDEAFDTAISNIGIINNEIDTAFVELSGLVEAKTNDVLDNVTTEAASFITKALKAM